MTNGMLSHWPMFSDMLSSKVHLVFFQELDEETEGENLRQAESEEETAVIGQEGFGLPRWLISLGGAEICFELGLLFLSVRVCIARPSPGRKMK